MKQNRRSGAVVRYSEAFKMSVVREIEQEGKLRSEVCLKYGIKGHRTVTRWLGKYGTGKAGRMIRVEKPDEQSELRKVRDRMKRLESLLADANLDLAIERGYLKLACQHAGIEDVEAFKKKQVRLCV